MMQSSLKMSHRVLKGRGDQCMSGEYPVTGNTRSQGNTQCMSALLSGDEYVPSIKIRAYLHINPIRSGGGGFKSPPPIFCSHAFNFGAALLCVGDFSKKIV